MKSIVLLADKSTSLYFGIQSIKSFIKRDDLTQILLEYQTSIDIDEEQFPYIEVV